MKKVKSILPDRNYKVFIKCNTYNQSRYINDTLNGFAIQKTNFPFICFVVDDCSTDGEVDIIKKYVEEQCDIHSAEMADSDISLTIKLSHKENSNCIFVFCLLKHNMYGNPAKAELYKPWLASAKYEAFCEGDDYWTNENKLQIQADFLDTHDDYVMCSHNFVEYYEGENVFDKQNYYTKHPVNPSWDKGCYWEYTFDNYYERWCTQPLTCMNRVISNNAIFDRRFMYKYVRDNVIYYYMLKLGKCAVFKDVMGVYRITPSGIYAGANKVQNEYVILHTYLEFVKNEKDYRYLEQLNARFYYSYIEEETNKKRLKEIIFLYLLVMPSFHDKCRIIKWVIDRMRVKLGYLKMSMKSKFL